MGRLSLKEIDLFGIDNETLDKILDRTFSMRKEVKGKKVEPLEFFLIDQFGEIKKTLKEGEGFTIEDGISWNIAYGRVQGSRPFPLTWFFNKDSMKKEQDRRKKKALKGGNKK